ncbi:helix-turn-helix domain-containing protein [Yinghuangia aomiensis]
MAEPRRSNRRGRRSREEILDAATRVMAERGYTATSLSTLSQATGLPKSAVYHHFHSKGGLLSAVMARGVRLLRRHARGPHRRPAARHPRRTPGLVPAAHRRGLPCPPRLPAPAPGPDDEPGRRRGRGRRPHRPGAHHGRAYGHQMIETSFSGEGSEVARVVADRLDRFAIAGFDGAFVGLQAEPGRGMREQMGLLAEAIAGLGERVAAEARKTR